MFRKSNNESFKERNESILVLQHIKKSFGGRTVLHDVSFEVRKGEILGIIGTSGGGKSTLFKIMLGYYLPDSGDVTFKGGNILQNLKQFKSAVGYTTQDDSFYKKLTVYENMEYYAGLYNLGLKGKKRKEHLLSLLEQVQLLQCKDSVVETLSGGTRRRLNFAISLVHNPEILVLDEPTTGLDPQLVKQFWEIIERVRKQGKTVIVTSHIFPELEEHCNGVVMLHKGRIAAVFDLKDLKKTLQQQFEEVLEKVK